MVDTANAPGRTDTAASARAVELNSIVDRVISEWSKKDTDSSGMDPFKILGLPYDASRNDVLTASGTLIRKVHPDVNRTNSDVSQSQLHEVLKGILWARDAADTEIQTGKSKQRQDNATGPDLVHAEMGVSPREVANAAMHGPDKPEQGLSRSGSVQRGQGSDYGNRDDRGGSGGGGRGPNIRQGSGAADEPENKKGINDLKKGDAWRDPLQAFVYGSDPTIFQGTSEAFVKLQMARLCGGASKQLGHRISNLELHYAVVGRNDKEYLKSKYSKSGDGDNAHRVTERRESSVSSWDERNIRLAVSAGRLMDQEMMLRLHVRNSILKMMDESSGLFGNINADHIDLIYKGVGFARGEKDAKGNYIVTKDSVVCSDFMAQITNKDHMKMRPAYAALQQGEFPEVAVFKYNEVELKLTREGIEQIKNAIHAVAYKSINLIDFKEFGELWAINGAREDWTAAQAKLATGLTEEVSYENGLIKGRFSLFFGMLESLAESTRAWRS